MDANLPVVTCQDESPWAHTDRAVAALRSAFDQGIKGAVARERDHQALLEHLDQAAPRPGLADSIHQMNSAAYMQAIESLRNQVAELQGKLERESAARKEAQESLARYKEACLAAETRADQAEGRAGIMMGETPCSKAMTEAKQSHAHRSKRLSEGCCPIHGIGLAQVGLSEVNGHSRFLAECPRKDCDIQATSETAHGPCTLLPAFAHLLSDPESQVG